MKNLQTTDQTICTLSKYKFRLLCPEEEIDQIGEEEKIIQHGWKNTLMEKLFFKYPRVISGKIKRTKILAKHRVAVHARTTTTTTITKQKFTMKKKEKTFLISWLYSSWYLHFSFNL